MGKRPEWHEPLNKYSNRTGAAERRDGSLLDPGEVWRVIARAPDFAISSLGRVKRIGGSSREALAATGRPKKLTVNRQGYCIVGLWFSGRTKTFLVHRLVCEAFHGPASASKPHAAHGNGKKSDNRADNLRWATPVENAADKEIHGTVMRGDGHPFSKLTSAAVAEIRNAPRGEVAHLAAKYGVNDTHVYRIRSRAAGLWAHVPFPPEDARP